jgi:hypothetical protein
MTLPTSADRFDVPAGAHVAVPGGGQVVYRRLAGAEPGIKDFRSDRDRGRPPAPGEPWIEHAGLSVFDAAEAAVSVVSRFPVFIAELAVPSPAEAELATPPCSIAKTGPAGHFTVWGPPEILAACVSRVFRQRYESGTLEIHR